MKNDSSVITSVPKEFTAVDLNQYGSVHPALAPQTLNQTSIESQVLDQLIHVERSIAENLVDSIGSLGVLKDSSDDTLLDRRRITRPMLSVVIPVYNERNSIIKIVESVKQLPISKQIIVVDDGSTDGTQQSILSIPQDGCLEFFFHISNQGKGAALQTGFRLAEGNIIIIQDADLEYDPQDIMKVIQPILDGQSSVVYGSRYLNSSPENSSWIHRTGNASLTALSNWVTGQRLTDMETCYKAFRREVLQKITIEQQRFGFEPEITAKLSRLGIQIPEVPVSYRARSWKEGKKIGLRDLWNAIYCILRYR